MIYIPNVWLKPYLKRKFYRQRGSTLAKMITRNRLLQSYEIQGGRARARRTASRQGRPTAGAAACRWARRAINARRRSFLPNAKMAISSCLVPSVENVSWWRNGVDVFSSLSSSIRVPPSIFAYVEASSMQIETTYLWALGLPLDC